jgi:hypothetical protein
MNHIAGPQRTPAGRNGLTDPDRPFSDGLLLDNGSALSLDRTSNARTHPQVIIRRVHNCVHAAVCDVALGNYQETPAYAFFDHGNRLPREAEDILFIRPFDGREIR